MKQKNLVLVAIAVVCGLVAAVLTAQMSASAPKKQQGILVPVAIKDLSVGTQLTGAKMEEFVEFKEFPQELLPAAFVANLDDLKDKRLTRNLRKGEAFNPQDITKTVALTPPEGYDMMAIECTTVEGVAGFVQPGSRVNVIAAIPSRRNQGRFTVVPFLLDMLVLAVDNQSQIVDGAASVPTMSSVSLAVTPEQALLLSGAKQRNCGMRLVLRHPTVPTTQEKVFTTKELWALLADEPIEESVPTDETKAVKEDKVKLAVAREDLPAGLKLTKEVIDEKFEMIEFSKPAPSQGIEDIREFTGQFLRNPLAQGQYIPKSFLGNDPAADKKPEVQPEAKPVEKPKPKKVEVPPVYHDVTIQTANGVKKIRYQKMLDGSFKYLGEVPLVEAEKKKSESEADEGTEANPPASQPEAGAPKTGEKL